MPQLNRNTWLIYYCFIALSTFFLLNSINSKYDELLSKSKNEQRYVTKIIQADTKTLLAQYETMIDLVNGDFNEKDDLNQLILKNILLKSELLIGFVIFNLDGTLRAKSNNLPDSLYSIKSNVYFDKGFSGGLTKDKLMISRAIFSPIMDAWIIPIRKALLDKNGKVSGFIASAIILEKLKQKWPFSETLNNKAILTLDKNFYQILNTGVAPAEYKTFYSNPLSAVQIKETKVQLKKQSLTFDMLRETGETAQIIIKPQNKSVLHSISYNKQYQFWTHTSQPLSNLITPLIMTTAYYLLLYLAFIITAFFIIKWILKIEKNKLIALTYKTEHDDLTGCYNRTALARLIGELNKSHTPFCLLYIGLDNFKRVNDTFGHQYGDMLLQEVTLRIQKKIQTISGKLIRSSGDEFILLLDHNNENVIRDLSTKLLCEIAKPYSIKHKSSSITCSIGITRSPDDARNLDTLLNYAESCMLVAKKIKNQCIFFSHELHQNKVKETRIEQALNQAIENNELSLVYQPQLDGEYNLSGVEALVRWHSNELGSIPPILFIPIAEKIGLMPKLGQYIMNKAMFEVAGLQKKLNVTFSLSINISVKQLMQSDFFELLIKSINDFSEKGLPLTIEVTESLFIGSIDTLRPLFKKMKEHNISLALDGFGAGYTSMSMLRDAPIDELKIDKGFVGHINDNNTDKAAVKNIIRMGKNLNMRVLAEGIETAKHAKTLSEFGCDLLQGYYLSKPLSIEELEVFIKK